MWQWLPSPSSSFPFSLKSLRIYNKRCEQRTIGGEEEEGGMEGEEGGVEYEPV